MKLLFAANVSHKLVKGLVSEYPGSTHVRDVGLGEAGDGENTDFRERSYVEGSAEGHLARCWQRGYGSRCGVATT